MDQDSGRLPRSTKSAKALRARLYFSSAAFGTYSVSHSKRSISALDFMVRTDSLSAVPHCFGIFRACGFHILQQPAFDALNLGIA